MTRKLKLYISRWNPRTRWWLYLLEAIINKQVFGMQSRYLCKVLYYWQALQYMLMTELVLQTATDIQHSKDTSKSCNIFGIQNSCNVLTSTRHALLELSSYIDGKNLIFPCLGSTMNRYCSLEMMKFLFKSKNRNKRLLKMSLL